MLYYCKDITVAPTSVVAPIFTLANFTCEGSGEILLWIVQGSSPADPSNQDREISVTTNNISVNVWSSVLTIRALPINNGISVGCAVISFNPYGYKQRGATLTIKGVSPVKYLAFYSTLMNSHLLAWSPPSFYSNDIPQGSIPIYHVDIKSKDGYVIKDDNTTDTFYELPDNLIVNCNVYDVSVIAFVQQYSSPATNITKENTDFCKIMLY